MFGDQRFWIPGRSLQGWQVVDIAHISQRYADVPEESAALYSPDRRTTEERPKLLLV